MTDHSLVRADDAETKWFNGDIYRFALTAEMTRGAIGMIDATVPPGGGPIPHIHEGSDEHYILISGDLQFTIGDAPLTLHAGDSLTIGRGTLHGFRNESIQPARIVFMFTPGGPERLFSLAGDDPVPATQVQLWGPERITPELLALAVKYDTIVPAPPGA